MGSSINMVKSGTVNCIERFPTYLILVCLFFWFDYSRPEANRSEKMLDRVIWWKWYSNGQRSFHPIHGKSFVEPSDYPFFKINFPQGLSYRFVYLAILNTGCLHSPSNDIWVRERERDVEINDCIQITDDF